MSPLKRLHYDDNHKKKLPTFMVTYRSPASGVSKTLLWCHTQFDFPPSFQSRVTRVGLAQRRAGAFAFMKSMKVLLQSFCFHGALSLERERRIRLIEQVGPRSNSTLDGSGRNSLPLQFLTFSFTTNFSTSGKSVQLKCPFFSPSLLLWSESVQR